jgi:hypothetical protein
MLEVGLKLLRLTGEVVDQEGANVAQNAKTKAIGKVDPREGPSR